ncbi:MAG: discoidin domain-containing protein, partial [Candidatus Hydrogenedentes bacterium]|nr:discoidin domain-containing protein [Candidatus Hydrogenedentota bacterium]
MKYRFRILVIALIASTAHAFDAPSANIAKGAAYTLGPAPNYSYCTDPGDAAQLTDGVYTQDYFWTQPTTVGWQGVRPAVIVLDLGADKPVRGVSYNAAAGTAGVYWPGSIQVFVGDDAKRFHWVGDLVTLSARKAAPPQGAYAVHRF